MKIILLIFMLSITLPTIAIAQQPSDHAQAMDDQLAMMSQRLQLTEEQQVLVEPILMAHFEDSRAIMESYGFSPKGASGKKLDMRKMKAMSEELQPIRTQAERELSAVLTDEQMTEYREIQDENRAKMRGEIQRRMGW